MLHDVLFEIGMEELPSSAVNQLRLALESRLIDALNAAKLEFESIQSFATPRRLAVVVNQLQSQQPAYQTEVLGPKQSAGYTSEGEPTMALMGFARAQGVSVDDLVVKDTDKGPKFAYEVSHEGQKVEDILPSMLKDICHDLPIRKPMRWGNHDTAFVRPVHWLVLMLDDKIVPLRLFGVDSNQYSYGHRYHAPEAISIVKPSSYVSQLEQAYVIADFEARRSRILTEMKSVFKSHPSLHLMMNDDLLDEVTSIVEWPITLLVDFNPDFLEVPAEALIAAMQQHQKCFPVQDDKGYLRPHFVAVSNINSQSSTAVITGNARVMEARLSDAQFFYSEDKKVSLENLAQQTQSVVFQQSLGSIQDKTKRVQQLMLKYAHFIEVNDKDVARAGQLSKADLLTGMVGEFPELQGIMGYYYALHAGESEIVAQAIKEQYYPRFAQDSLPESALGLLLSLMDRIDTLVGIFAVGLKPTGEKDPFKLRRHALAVIRLLNAMPFSISLTALLNQAQILLPELRLDAVPSMLPTHDIVSAVHEFILERLPSYYHDDVSDVSWINATLACQDDDLRDIDCRLKSLNAFMQSSEAGRLSKASKRVHKILQQAGMLDSSSTLQSKSSTVSIELFQQKQEQVLYDHIMNIEHFVSVQIKEQAYEAILCELANLAEPLDAFFECVMVMDDDLAIQSNRLSILNRLQVILRSVVDISRLGANVSKP